MARLIDADKIRYRDMSDGHVPNGVWYTFLEDIEKHPTVKAIPVKWLKAKAEKWASSNDVLMWGQCVKLLIEDWEKENEAD